QILIFCEMIGRTRAVILSEIEGRVGKHGVDRLALERRKHIKAISLVQRAQTCMEHWLQCTAPALPADSPWRYRLILSENNVSSLFPKVECICLQRDPSRFTTRHSPTNCVHTSSRSAHNHRRPDYPTLSSPPSPRGQTAPGTAPPSTPR